MSDELEKAVEAMWGDWAEAIVRRTDRELGLVTLDGPAKMYVFETLALSQKPAAQAWQPVTDYYFETRRVIEGKQPALILETFRPQSIVDVGCGPEAILVRLLRELGADVYGIDVQVQVDRYPVVYGDVTQRGMEWCASNDLVICREVLEHLTLLQIRHAVTNLCKLSKRYVYVTTRFSSEHDILRVETKDDLDPTHITIPSKDLLRLLFVLEGFKRRADLEQAMDWQKKNRCLVYERV